MCGVVVVVVEGIHACRVCALTRHIWCVRVRARTLEAARSSSEITNSSLGRCAPSVGVLCDRLVDTPEWAPISECVRAGASDRLREAMHGKRCPRRPRCPRCPSAVGVSVRVCV